MISLLHLLPSLSPQGLIRGSFGATSLLKRSLSNNVNDNALPFPATEPCQATLPVADLNYETYMSEDPKEGIAPVIMLHGWLFECHGIVFFAFCLR